MSEDAQVRTELSNCFQTVYWPTVLDAAGVILVRVQCNSDASNGAVPRLGDSSNISEAITASGKLEFIELDDQRLAYVNARLVVNAITESPCKRPCNPLGPDKTIDKSSGQHQEHKFYFPPFL